MATTGWNVKPATSGALSVNSSGNLQFLKLDIQDSMDIPFFKKDDFILSDTIRDFKQSLTKNMR